MCEMYESADVLFYTAKHRAREIMGLKSGDKIVITGGLVNGRTGNTNMLKIETI